MEDFFFVDYELKYVIIGKNIRYVKKSVSTGKIVIEFGLNRKEPVWIQGLYWLHRKILVQS